ncbi:hypothetical protein J22TS1_01110 [Siminovitchia terrae]|nr:hypothetical protein J22TS1_01110 [Siminovitchia terrae]
MPLKKLPIFVFLSEIDINCCFLNHSSFSIMLRWLQRYFFIKEENWNDLTEKTNPKNRLRDYINFDADDDRELGHYL